MNLAATISLYGGGPGSGCTGPNCGRPEGAAEPLKQKKWRIYDSRKVGGYFKKGAAIAQMYESLVRQEGEWVPVQHFEEKHAGKANILNRVEQLRYTGKRAGLWELRKSGDKISLVRIKKEQGKGEEESKLSSSKITSKRELGGGINNSFMVTFEDGRKGVFKEAAVGSGRANIPSGKDSEREVAAWRIAKLVGMQDMVQPTVLATVEGMKGMLQTWANGEMAHQAASPWDKNDLYRAAAFDYVIGNEDRHKGNWLVEGDKLHLIDHGLSLPEGKCALMIGMQDFWQRQKMQRS